MGAAVGKAGEFFSNLMKKKPEPEEADENVDDPDTEKENPEDGDEATLKQIHS